MLNCYIFQNKQQNKLKTIKVKLLDHNCTRRLNRCKTKIFCTEIGNKRCISNFCILRRKKITQYVRDVVMEFLFFASFLPVKRLFYNIFCIPKHMCRQENMQMQKISESLSLIFQQTIVNGKYIPRHLDIVIAQNSHQTFKTTFRSKL